MSYFLSALQNDPHVIYQSRHIYDSVFTFYQQEWPFQNASSSGYLDSAYGFQFKLRAQGDSESLPFQTVFKPRFANLTDTMEALVESLRNGPEQHSRALAAFYKANILLGFIDITQVHTNVLTSESQRLRGILLLIDDLKRQKRECETDLKSIVSLGPPPANWESSLRKERGIMSIAFYITDMSSGGTI
ncbi:hypothetical protein DL98DRAFT_540203 [Cadophora sp. DSE1049]|nr:hypothetical protein DL98DRAFT_540203 [Cadophora sp. DSE1049]